jgi:pimeloyl-ACP methyl ester carboxylesterase
MIQYFTYGKKETIAYNDIGNKSLFPIFVQHGSMASIKDVELFEELKNHARPICIARPGYGESSPYTLKNILEYGNIVSQLVKRLSIKQFDILSSSAGAPYGYALARACENEIRNTYVYSGTPALYDEDIQKKWPFQVNKNLTVEDSQKAAYEEFLTNVPVSELGKNYIKDSIVNKCFGGGLNLRIRCNDWGFKLSEIKTKVYMQHSKQDSIIPYELAIMTKALLPNCEIELLEKGEHFTEKGYKLFMKRTIIKKIV